jgi:hypothetical protein
MNLKQLSLVERTTLIGGRALEATVVFHEKRAEDITVEDLHKLRDKMTRVIDLIEESEGHLQ